MRISKDIMVFNDIDNLKDCVGIYNTFLHSFAIIHREIYKYLSSNLQENSSADIYSDLSKEQIQTLMDYGILIDNEQDYISRKHQTLRNPREQKIHIAYLHLTLRCNLACEYCYIADAINQASNELSPKQWIDIIGLLRSKGLEKIIITGGEPFMYEGLTEVINFAKSIGLHVTVLTNGTLLDNGSEIFEMIDNCIISLDSQYASKRKGIGQYNVVGNIIEIAKKYPSKIITRSVVVRGMESEVVELGQLLKENDIPHIKALCLPNCPQEINLIPDYEKFSLYSDDPLSPVPCGAGNGLIAVDAVGNIFPCQSLIKPEFMIANIFDTDWENKYNNSIIHNALRVFDKEKCETCSACIAKHLCNGGCRAIAHNVYGDITKPCDFLCDYYRKSAVVSIQSNFTKEAEAFQ